MTLTKVHGSTNNTPFNQPVEEENGVGLEKKTTKVFVDRVTTGTPFYIPTNPHADDFERIESRPLLPSNQPTKSPNENAQVNLSELGAKLREGTFVTIDTLATAMSGISLASVVLQSSGIEIPALDDSVLGIEIAMGTLLIGAAIFDRIPHLLAELQKSRELDDKEGIDLAFMNLSLWGTFFVTGVVLLGVGTVNLLHDKLSLFSDAAMDVMGYAFDFLSIYTLIRGLLLMGKSAYSLNYLFDFQKGFEAAEDVKGKIEFLKDEYTRDRAHFERCVGSDAADEMKKYMEGSASVGKIDLLKLVDRGTAAERYKQYIMGTIFLGVEIGVIAGLVVTSGAGGSVASMIANAAFTVVGALFLSADSSWIFNGIVDMFHTPMNLSDLKIEETVEGQEAS